MKILYITNKPIFPIVDGGCKAMHQFLLCLLKRDVIIDHICISTQKHPFDIQNYPKNISDKLRIKSFYIDTTIRKSQAIKQLFKRSSYNIERFDVSEIHEYLKKTLDKENYDHIIFESLYLCPYISTIRNNSNSKITLRTHNIEHQIWEQLAKNTSNPLKKWYLNKLANDLKRYESDVLNKVDFIASIAESDSRELEKLGVKIPVTTIPVAIEQSPVEINYSNQNLFFLGSMNWSPNIEAVEWIIYKILPAIRTRIPMLDFHLAGSFMKDQFPTDKRNGIINHNFVPNSANFMKNNGILILPIKTASGVRVKMLEAMSLGIPVVTTKAGAQGINETSSLFIAENTSELIEYTIQLCESQEKRKELGLRGYEYIQKNYSVTTISDLIYECLEKL